MAMTSTQELSSKSSDQAPVKCPQVIPGDEFKDDHASKTAPQRYGDFTPLKSTILGSQNRKPWEDLSMQSLGAMLLDGHRTTAMERDLLSSLLAPQEENRGQLAGEEKDGWGKRDNQSPRETHISAECVITPKD
jgi:hypothetical protein